MEDKMNDGIDQDDMFAAGGEELDEFDVDMTPTKGKKAPQEGEKASTGESTAKPDETAPGATESVQKPPVVKKQTKRATKPLTGCDKAVRLMLRRAGLDELPTIDHIMRGKEGTTKMPISDIALFIGIPTDSVLADLAKQCPVKNIVNLSAEVLKSRVMSIGAQILTSGRMYQPIQVAKVNREWQCTSGRHRLAFLALAYGASAKIAVYVEEMTLCEARDAVVVANQARPTKALERAEHAVLQAVGGDVDAKQAEMYSKTVLTKAKAKKYCVYSVLEKGHPTRLTFPVSLTSSRKDGGLTTITNVENYWGAAIDWHKDTEQKDFDASLESATEFLNKLAKELQAVSGFEASHHMASMTLSAIGKWYRSYVDVNGASPDDKAGVIAKAVVAMGAIGRQKSEQTYDALKKAMRA
jgi:hypothetical protein